MERLVTAALVLTTAACTPAGTATTPAQPAPSAAPVAAAPASAVNPVGRYQFSTTRGGQPVDATLTISGTPGAYTGTLDAHMGSDAFPVTGVTVNGQEMVVTSDVGGGSLTLRLTFTDANTFTGSWSLGMDGAPVTGHRVTS